MVTTVAEQRAPTTVPYTMVSFRPTPEVESELAARASSVGTAAKIAVGRYFAILAASRRAFSFTRDEATALARAFRDFELNEQTIDLLHARLEIQFDRRGAEATVDPRRLIERVRRLTTPQKIALVDAIERYWRVPPETPEEIVDRLSVVGLIERPAEIV